MIISASRRTDIPAYHLDWFLYRLREGFVSTRNPMNPKQIKTIDLSVDSVDGIVFWTKNAAKMLDHLRALSEYAYYVQLTITGYGPDIEPGLPDKENEVIPAFQRLSDAIGAQRVIWRHDPVFISDTYTMEAHCGRFDAIARGLCGYTEACVLSFMDMYRCIQKNVAKHGIRVCDEREMRAVADSFSKIAASARIKLQTCAEPIDLGAYGIEHGCCVDASRIEKISGKGIKAKKDPNQRPACGCAQSVDIGAYNTCANGCVYCYANHRGALAIQNELRGDIKRAFLLE